MERMRVRTEYVKKSARNEKRHEHNKEILSHHERRRFESLSSIITNFSKRSRVNSQSIVFESFNQKINYIDGSLREHQNCITKIFNFHFNHRIGFDGDLFHCDDCNFTKIFVFTFVKDFRFASPVLAISFIDIIMQTKSSVFFFLMNRIL